MPPSDANRFFRGCALAACLSGLALIVFALFHPDRDARYALEPSWVWEHQLGMLAFVALPLGLVGIYGVQIRPSGWPGLIGFLIAFAGTVLYSGGIFMDAYFFSWLAEQAPQVVTGVLTANLPGPALVGLGLASTSFTFGLMLLGFATFQAKVLPRTAAVLLVVGAPLFGPGSALPKLLQVGGAVVLGVALIWLGYAAWATKPSVTASLN